MNENLAALIARVETNKGQDQEQINGKRICAKWSVHEQKVLLYTFDKAVQIWVPFDAKNI